MKLPAVALEPSEFKGLAALLHGGGGPGREAVAFRGLREGDGDPNEGTVKIQIIYCGV